MSAAATSPSPSGRDHGYPTTSLPGYVLDEAEVNDGFGSRLAAGDFDGDGFDDLAVGVWGEDLSGEINAGVSTVIWIAP